MMKRWFLSLFVYCSLYSFSQVFWTEGFTVGTTCASGTSASGYISSNGTWTVTNTGTNNSSANAWFVSGKEKGMGAGVCGTGCGSPQNKTLHLGSTGFFTDLGAAYNATGSGNITDKRAESPTINCSGKSGITLSFNYMEFGEGASDNAILYYFDGTTWSLLIDIPKTLCCGSVTCNGSTQALWTAYSIALPPSANNNTSVKIGFRWVNNGNGVGTDPSFAVDDIRLSVPVVLPVELKDFSLSVNEQNFTTLSWHTLSERNFDLFIIERSFDGIDFYGIGTLSAMHDNKSMKTYSFYDTQQLEEATYYRLKIVDSDKSYVYSDLLSANPNTKSRLPNEWVNEGFFEINSEWLKENQLSRVCIYNVEGRKIASYSLKEMEEQNLRTKVPLTGLSSGIYFCQFSNDNFQKSFKFSISQ